MEPLLLHHGAGEFAKIVLLVKGDSGRYDVEHRLLGERVEVEPEGIQADAVAVRRVVERYYVGWAREFSAHEHAMQCKADLVVHEHPRIYLRDVRYEAGENLLEFLAGLVPEIVGARMLVVNGLENLKARFLEAVQAVDGPGTQMVRRDVGDMRTALLAQEPPHCPARELAEGEVEEGIALFLLERARDLFERVFPPHGYREARVREERK